MPASDFSLWVPAITCLVLLFGVALYLQSKGLQDPAAMVAKSPRLTGVVFILLVGLITSALFASQYKGAKDGGSFMVPEKAIGLGVAISILGIVMVILGPRQLILPLGPEFRRLTFPQAVFLAAFLSIVLGAFFGFPWLMEQLGWQVRRIP